jgi:hypothetical protein
MRKSNHTYISIRQRYQEKRSGEDYHKKRKSRVERWKRGETYHFSVRSKNVDIINLKAPTDFSFIDNTDDILEYIRIGRQVIRNNQSVRFDIADISRLTPEVIPLLISHLRDPNFNRSLAIHGNAPSNNKFQKIFTESGFYSYVRSRTKFQASDLSLMHNESNVKVKPDLAGKAVEMIMNHGKYGEDYIEPIYNIFIELMSNTHSHANLNKFGISKWWLYAYVNEDNKTIDISFTDLGVGIFKSVIVKSYLKRIGRSLKMVDNSTLVKDLLDGKIQSRIEKDREIRGKGIPQILEYSHLDCFKQFYLITNDMKIDFKTRASTKLKESLHGTFYFIQLKSN